MAVEFCLREAGISLNEVNEIAIGRDPKAKLDKKMLYLLKNPGGGWNAVLDRIKNAKKISSLEQEFHKIDPSVSIKEIKLKIRQVEHHRSHLASAFFASPFEEAALLSIDGSGDFTTTMIAVGRGNQIEVLDSVDFPHSVGIFYTAFTQLLGFPHYGDEYKVMGLAAYGRPTMVDQVRKVIRRTPDGAFAIVPQYFEYQTTATRSYSSKFVDLFGPPRPAYEPIDVETAEGRRFADIAASVQRVLEDTLVDIARALQQETKLPDLCFGGGVALNGVANARILAESGFERVFVPPAPGDAGCALGAALYADRLYFKNPDRDVPDHPFWGPAVDAAHLARAAREDDQHVDELDDGALIERVAADLAADRIVGWMDGASEYGPRALGHRSLLAAPHAIGMRDRLNRDIKHREEFRPFAPVVTAEAADRYFELPAGGARLARFMSGVFPVRPEWRAELAAVTHVDGSARVQVLERSMAPRLHALLEAYARRRGIPVLLNTSFNVAGEPIVNAALEGYSTFRRCGIDALVAGSAVVTKRATASAKLAKEHVA